MIFQIKIAERVVEICSIYNLAYIYCREYRTENCKPDIIVQITTEEIEEERNKLYPVFLRRDIHRPMYVDGYAEFLLILRKIANEMLSFSTILLHGAAVSDGKKAYIFAAPSGTGKTTRALRFLRDVPGSCIINGDKPLLHIENGEVMVYGTPWCGKEDLGRNISVPVNAILFLERSDQSNLTELTVSDALPYLIQQVYFPPYCQFETMKLLKKMSRIRFYHYQSINNSADVLEIYKKVMNSSSI